MKASLVDFLVKMFGSTASSRNPSWQRGAASLSPLVRPRVDRLSPWSTEAAQERILLESGLGTPQNRSRILGLDLA